MLNTVIRITLGDPNSGLIALMKEVFNELRLRKYFKNYRKMHQKRESCIEKKGIRKMAKRHLVIGRSSQRQSVGDSAFSRYTPFALLIKVYSRKGVILQNFDSILRIRCIHSCLPN